MGPLILSLSLVFTAFLTACGGGGGGPTNSGAWTANASMPTGRAVPAAGVIAGKLYVAGGATGGLTFAPVVSATLEVYDPAINTWVVLASLPTPKAHPAAGVIAGVLYVAGGTTGSAAAPVVVISLESYTPLTNTWAEATPMPGPRAHAAAGVIDGKLYVAGGANTSDQENAPVATLEVYDPLTNRWTTKTPMPTARHGPTGGVIAGKLYVVGGHTGLTFHTVSTVFEAYDPAANTWTSLASIPTARSHPAAVGLNGKLYVVGGSDAENNPLTTVEVYDPATNTWTTLAAMPTARWGVANGVIGGLLYLAGGSTASAIAPTATLEVFTSP